MSIPSFGLRLKAYYAPAAAALSPKAQRFTASALTSPLRGAYAILRHAKYCAYIKESGCVALISHGVVLANQLFANFSRPIELQDFKIKF